MDCVIVMAIVVGVIALVLYARWESAQTKPVICDSGCCGAEVCDCVPSATGKKVITQNIYRNRNGKRSKVGIITSNLKRGKVLVGYSLCCKTDEFNEKEGLILAGKRMGQEEVAVVPGIRKDMIKFLDRCSRYYRTAKMPTFTNDTIKNR